jgi:chemotaxis protein CheZ
MDTEEVSAGIEQLVDHLRASKSAATDLGDIAGVTEILLATMRRFFNSIDTTLYTEFRSLSEYIQRARSEISELRPNDLKHERIPRAGLELEAIVASTEEATGTIMDAAEEIMSADPAAEGYGDAVNEACMRIFEACSFQDITGQRITKVVATLTYIEERLHGLQEAWGPDIADADGETPLPGVDDDARPDGDLLNGPALVGEGILQDQVDDLFGEAVTADMTGKKIGGGVEIEVEPDAIEAVEEPGHEERNGHTNGESHEEGHEESHEENAGANQQATAEPAAIKTTDEPKLDDIVLLSSKGKEEATQADIDALFD